MGKPKLAVVYYKDSKNIGDDIQTYAAARLLPKVDCYLDRESLHRPPTDEPIKLVCNGWFMKNPENWPPAPNIEPLFISVHIDTKSGADKKMFIPERLAYFKKYEPIGCRDYFTKELFEKNGVNAYFSGCMTLTIASDIQEKTDTVYLAEPFTKFLVPHYIKYCLSRLVPESVWTRVKKSVHYPLKLNDKSVEQRLKNAKDLLDEYARAQLVITSRIHCALPCLGMDTPVYFTDVGYNRRNAKNRFGGLGKFFTIIGDDYFPLTNNKPWGKLMRLFFLYYFFPKKDPIPIDWHPKKVDKPQELKDVIEGLKRRVAEFIA